MARWQMRSCPAKRGSVRWHRRYPLVLLVMLALATSDANEPELLLSAPPSLPPLRIVFGEESTEDQCQSFAGEILREALTRRAGVKMVCDSVPWERAQLMVRTGQRDAFLATKNADRASYTVAGNEPVLTSRLVIFTLATHAKLADLKRVRTIAELKPYRVLTYRGDGWVKNHLLPAGITVEWSEDPSAVLRKLASGRGDLFIQTDIDTLRLIRQLQLDNQVIMLPNELSKIQHFLMISKHSPWVTEQPRFDAAFRAMQVEGLLDSLHKQP